MLKKEEICSVVCEGEWVDKPDSVGLYFFPGKNGLYLAFYTDGYLRLLGYLSEGVWMREYATVNLEDINTTKFYKAIVPKGESNESN